MDDLKKYFDNSNYVTKIIGIDTDENISYGNILSTLISLLIQPENKDFKEEALLTLKKEKAGNLLIEAVKKTKKDKHILVAACWESEIDFSNELKFFVTLALDKDYLISLEAITVIGTMKGPFNNEEVKECIKRIKEEIKKTNSERLVLLNDLFVSLESFLK